MNFRIGSLLTLLILFTVFTTGNVLAQTKEEIKELQDEKPEKKKKEKKEKKTKKTKVKKESTKKEKVVKEKKEPSTKDSKTDIEKPVKKEKVKKEKSKSSFTNVMNKPLRTWSFDLGINTTNPQTDIRYHDFFGTLKPVNEYKYGGQLRITKMLDNAIGVQLQFAYNKVHGVYDTLAPFSEDRQYMENAGITEGVYFKSDIMQGSFNLYWNISNTVFNLNRHYRSVRTKQPMQKRWFSLYAYSGVGISIFKPELLKLSDNTVVDNNTFAGINIHTEQSTEAVIPVALGAKFKLSNTIDLGFEAGYNFIFTDKLDGFNYDHPGRFKDDGYTHASMVLSFKLGGKKIAKEHIEWVNAMDPMMAEIAKIAKLEKKINRIAKDEDEDGVSDYFDKDTETAEGATVGANGIALDSDNDGVLDDNDMEIFTPKGAEVDEQGRALDTDGDGVPNYRDAEDGTSSGAFVNFQGRSIDDNIKPNEGTSIRNIAFPSIFFDTDKANIKREYEDELFQMALTIKRNSGLKFILEGHCDERGSADYNIALGNRRAEAVRQYLVDNYKLDPELFIIQSKGRDEVMSPRFNINRRVDVLLAN